MHSAVRPLLLILATARLTRLVTVDDLGWWWVRRPAGRWAMRHDGGRTEHIHHDEHTTEMVMVPEPDYGWRSKLVSGLDCRWCVGFWLAVGVLVAEVTVGRVPVLRALWTFALTALALNAAANAAGKALGTLP